MRLRYTDSARSDLLDIWLLIASRDVSTAEAVARKIGTRCARLAQFPRSGRARPEVAPDIRSLVVERWVVLYRVAQGHVDIVRIVDGARNLSDLDLPNE